jgi:glycosyltransferase involved in cell wall biosynthesis
MRKKILLLYYDQLGYHTDLYMYGKFLNTQKYEVHFFCFDQGLPKIVLKNVNIHYQSLNSNRIKSFLKYFWHLKLLLLRKKFDLIFHLDSKFTLIIRMLNPFQPMILDIRSGDLSDNRYKLWFRNRQITFVTVFYKNVSVISESLRNVLRLSKKKTVIIPLGGEKQCTLPKTFRKFQLLYVGSIDNRNIHETILGLSLYLKKKEALQDISYDIIGFGKSQVINKINEVIINSGLKGVVSFHGRKKIDELFPFFEKCNLGVVYVPQKKAYDCQPVTKLFEYVLAGMPVIATNTLENKLSLKPNCGVITDDNPVSFAEALENVIQNSGNYDSEKIKELYSEFEWKNIVINKLEPYFEKVIKE